MCTKAAWVKDKAKYCPSRRPFINPPLTPYLSFLQHWRRRYFVLSGSPAAATPGGAQSPSGPSPTLSYYDSDRMGRKKGSIDLEGCEIVLQGLDSDQHRHVFALRTRYRGQARTYYLAADSEEEMRRWVGGICRVLRMDDMGELAPPPSPPHTHESEVDPTWGRRFSYFCVYKLTFC